MITNIQLDEMEQHVRHKAAAAKAIGYDLVTVTFGAE